MGVIEDRATGSGELLLAGRLKALVKALADVLCRALARDPADAITAADRAANDAIGPAHLLDVLQALFIVRELLSDVYQVHDLTRMPQLAFCVKCIIIATDILLSTS